MDLLAPRSGVSDLQPGLVVAEPKPPAPADLVVRTDVACLLRVRRSPTPLEGTEAFPLETLWLPKLPGSPEGAHCKYVIEHHTLESWTEGPFTKEFRTIRPAMARQFLDNGGKTLELVDVTFTVPPLDPELLAEQRGAPVPEADLYDLAEQRETASLLAFYDWALDRTDTINGGAISQICLPEVWTRHVHLLPDIWARVAEWCRGTGNRFLVADSAPPLKVLQEEERKKARADGYDLTEDELTAAALVPWHRAEHWVAWGADVPVEVALTLDAVDAVETVLGLRTETASFLAVYWPWIQNLRGMDLPPSAAVSGVYSRSDAENAPFGSKKPPANEQVKAVFDLALQIDEHPTNLLRRAGINLLVPRIGRGVVVWGARTQCEDEAWRFVSVRRLIGFIGKQLQLDNQWAVFENNTPELRARVARDARYFLRELYEKGALTGETPEAAFRVSCDEQNNPRRIVDAGALMVDVWVRPVQTNEFVHLQLAYTDALDE